MTLDGQDINLDILDTAGQEDYVRQHASISVELVDYTILTDDIFFIIFFK